MVTVYNLDVLLSQFETNALFHIKLKSFCTAKESINNPFLLTVEESSLCSTSSPALVIDRHRSEAQSGKMSIHM